jgi:hypothetical protein
VAVSRIGFGGDGTGGNQGHWPVRSAAGSPGLLVSRATLLLPGTNEELSGRLRILAGDARIERDDAVLWSGGADCGGELGCRFVIPAAPDAGPARLWAEQAVLLGLGPENDRDPARGGLEAVGPAPEPR